MLHTAKVVRVIVSDISIGCTSSALMTLLLHLVLALFLLHVVYYALTTTPHIHLTYTSFRINTSAPPLQHTLEIPASWLG
jgi:hypothetical protein